MTVNFEADNYSVDEGSAEEICLILNGSTEVSVVVNLVGEEGTASTFESFKWSIPIYCYFCSGGSDYNIDVTELTFTAGSNLRECTALVANDDLALENSEVLTLFLTTDVIHNMQPISVTIIDNDSALLVPHLNTMHTICNFFVIDATVSFSLPSFTAVEESEVATICVTLEDDIQRNVTVTLSSTEQCKIHYLSLFYLNYPHHYFCLCYS